MNISKDKVFLFLVSILLVGQVFQYFTKITNIPTFTPALIGLIAYSIFVYPRVFFRPSVFSTILLYLSISLYDISNHLNNLPPVLLSPFGTFSMVFPFFTTALVIENLLILKKENKRIIYYLGKISFIIIILSITVNLVSELMFPGITRSVGFNNFPNMAWSMSFGTFYAIPFIYMVVLNYYKSSGFGLFLLSFLFVAMILTAGFITALALTAGTSIIGLLFRFKVKNKLFIFGVFLSISFMVLSNLGAVIELFPNLPNPIYLQKAAEIYNLQYSSSLSDIASNSRAGVYDITIEAIKLNPIFGSGDYDKIGQHSFWLDKLGFLGIVGVLFHINVFLKLYFGAKNILLRSQRNNYYILVLIVFGFLFLNPIQ